MLRKDTDVAWCAGFFDGEGCVAYNRSRPSKHGVVSPLLVATVPQNAENVEVLEFFQSIVGFGRIYGPYATSKGKTRYDLKYKTKEVEPLFEILKPYLRAEKTLDFTRALELYNNHNHNITVDDLVRISSNDLKAARRRYM